MIRIMKHIIFSFIFLAAASAAYASSPKKSSVIPTSKVMTHDPVLAKQGDTYYLFATGHGISVMSSKDLKNWKFEKPVFEKAPQWAVETVKGYNGHTWAPDYFPQWTLSFVLFMFGIWKEYFGYWSRNQSYARPFQS